MTINEARTIAEANRAAHKALPFQERVWMSANDEWERFGYRHGWWHAGDHAFSDEDLGGYTYDSTQAGWAYL